MDKNQDGRVDIEDMKEVAGSVRDGVRDMADSFARTVDEKSYDFEERRLQPIKMEEVRFEDFQLSTIIRICEQDVKRAENRVCEGEIGYRTDVRGTKIVNIYEQNVAAFGITLVPDASYEFYYVDPSDSNCYIALDEYYTYLKQQQINELQKIAHDLGAKHFKVTYKEEKTCFSNKRKKEEVGVISGQCEGEKELSAGEFSTLQIAAEMECNGHEPQEPVLQYLKNDSGMKTLIEMRMKEDSNLCRQKYLINLSNTSGIKEREALVIDAFLKKCKCSGNATMVSESQAESRRYLEYEIEF